jgi:hypothetical protein
MKRSITTCVTCGADVVQKSGSGRIRKYCDRECWPSASRVPTHAGGSCTICGAEMLWSQVAQPVCVQCRRQGTHRSPELHHCPTCKRMYETTRSRQVYCSAECSPHTTGTTTQRGYGADHVRMRRQWSTLVEIGAAECSLCGESVEPSDRWHMDHTDDRQGYRGVAHALCNLREGAIKGNRSPGRRRRRGVGLAS